MKVEFAWYKPCPRCGDKLVLVPGTERMGGLGGLVRCRQCGKQQQVMQLNIAKAKAKGVDQ